MNLFNIAAALTLDTGEYEKGLTNAEKKTSNFGATIGKGFKAVGAGVAAVGTAATALGVSFYKGVGETAEYGDNIDKMSQKIGISAEAFQEWDFILQHSGSSVDALKPAMKTLSAAASSGSDAFKELGLSQEQIASMSSEELFGATITALQGMDDETKRTELAMSLLGKSGMEMGALLNTSADDTAAMKQQVHDLGGVMSNDGVKNAAKYQDSLQNLQTATAGLKRNLLSQFMPAVSTVFDGLAAIFSGDSESGISQITEGVTELSNKLLEKIPEFVPVVTSILLAIGTAMVENAPALIDSALMLLNQLSNSVIENLPMILEVVLTIIENIATQIGEDLPVLLPSIISAILTVAQTLIDHLPELLNALGTLIDGLAQGIINSIPVILEKLPSIISSVVDALTATDTLKQLIETGVTLFVALIGAMPDIIKTIVDALPDIITSVIEALTDTEVLKQIIQAGVTLLGAIVEAIPEIIVSIVEAIPDIITSIVDGIKAGWENVKEAGKELISGVWNGIKDKASWLWEQVKGWASGLLDKVKGFFGIHSPSTKFRDIIGKNLVAGLGDGIDRYADIALDSMERLAGDILDAATIEPTVTFGTNGLGDSLGAFRAVQLTQNIYAAEMTPSEVFEEAREQQERLVLLGV